MSPLGTPGYECGLSPDEAWDPALIERYATSPNLFLIALSALPSRSATRADAAHVMSRMTPGQRMIVATSVVENHVNQGGFGKLWCYGGWALEEAIDGYKLVGADRLAEVLRKALGAADWNLAGRDDDALSDETSRVLELLNHEYYELDNGNPDAVAHGAYALGALKNAFMRTHPEQFPRVARSREA